MAWIILKVSNLLIESPCQNEENRPDCEENIAKFATLIIR